MYKAACLLIVALFGVINCVPSQYDNTEYWVPGNLSIALPSNVVIGGVDAYGHTVYVGRYNLSGTILPARVVAETGVATCNSDSAAGSSTTYQLLTTKDDVDYEWIRSYDGYYEDNAVSVGTSSWNEMVFICRSKVERAVVMGTLFTSKKACLIHVGQYIHLYHKYEILVANPKVNGTIY